MASVRCYEQQHQAGMPSRPQVEYFYVYVAESEFLNTGNWILLEPDKSLSLVSLRGYYATCFGIKYKFINAGNVVETRYIRYHNGYFRFPAGLDMNNTRFVAYYYNDKDDVNAFMEMAEANDDGTGTLPALEFKDHQPVQQQLQQVHNDSTFLGRTAMNFEMEKVLVHGAQSTPNKSMPGGYVSSTSDVILQEKTMEVISVHDSRSMVVTNPPPPPPPGPPQHQAPKMQQPKEVPIVPAPPVLTGVKAKLGPSVSSTSDVVKGGHRTARGGPRNKRDNYDNDSSGFQREKSSVMIKPEVVPKSKNMLNRYQQRRAPPEDVSEKTPLKITLNTRGNHTERNAKILKIEDEKGRTTALLTKRKWGGKPAAPARNNNKRRYEPEPEEPYETGQYEKRRRYETTHNQQYYHHQQEARTSPVYDDYYRTLNVLLVGFNTTAPDIHETTTYFSEFGTVQDLHLYSLDNRHNHAEFYAFMTIRTDNAVSLFSDRHLYNGTVIYAIRVDGDRLPSRLTCKVCGYQGINVGYLHYHLEGFPHQSQLQKRLDALAVTVPNVYRDSYYRTSRDEVYVQYPNDAIQELVRNDYWKRTRPTTTYSSAAAPANRYYSTERERYY